jgi:enamine deaminase RidA (YjgF/YER057c/UK114 family)
MSDRTSINFGRKHANPIPNACRIGNLVMSSVIIGTDPVSGEMPPDMETQCSNMFVHVRGIAETAGGSTDDIIKMTVWLKNLNDRAALNEEWLRMFPDPASRPARHAHQYVGDLTALIQCDVTLYLSTGTASKAGGA